MTESFTANVIEGTVLFYVLPTFGAVMYCMPRVQIGPKNPDLSDILLLLHFFLIFNLPQVFGVLDPICYVFTVLNLQNPPSPTPYLFTPPCSPPSSYCLASHSSQATSL